MASRAGTPQVVLYQPGIGTAESRWFANLLDQAFGTGMDEKILAAYNFICHNYEAPNDKIILIGFSRGAFVMRCVADLIHKVGLLTKRGLTHLPTVFKEWRAGHPDPLGRPWVGNENRRSWMQHFSSFWPLGQAQDPPAAGTLRGQLDGNSLRSNILVDVCALWDTVSSIGTPWPALFRLPTSTSLTFIDSSLGGIREAFQAIALHETRWNFPPIVWRSSPNRGATELEQCWFMGYHSDIGGGKKHDTLAHVALAWMLAKLDERHLDLEWEALWEPRFTEDSSWKVSQTGSGDSRLMITVQSSMTTLFWFMGSKIRIPRSQFWNGRGPDDVNPVGQPADVSGERMHRTVHIWNDMRAMPEPAPALDNCIQPANSVDEWQLRRTEDHELFPVRQAAMEQKERNVLIQWLHAETRYLQTHAELGQRQPRTSIPDIIARLELAP